MEKDEFVAYCGEKTLDEIPSKNSGSASNLNDGLCRKMTAKELVAVFETEGMMITLGAQYSVKGQIAQLLNGLKRLGIEAT